MSTTNELVMQQLSTVIEPELDRDIVSLRMVRDLEIKGDTAVFTIVLTTPACPLKNVFETRCNEAIIGKVPGITKLDIKWTRSSRQIAAWAARTSGASAALSL